MTVLAGLDVAGDADRVLPILDKYATLAEES